MTQKKLNTELQRLLDTGIKFHEVEIPDYEIVQTVVIVGGLEFEIARRKINRQTLTEGSDWLELMDEKATLKTDTWLLISKLNFIYERQPK
jgi:hypothetical protein